MLPAQTLSSRLYAAATLRAARHAVSSGRQLRSAPLFAAAFAPDATLSLSLSFDYFIHCR